MKTVFSDGVFNLGWTLLHFLWQGALVALACALIQLFWRKNRASQRYAINCAGMLLMAVLPVITFVWLWTRGVPVPAPVVLPPSEVMARSGAVAAKPFVTLALPPVVGGARVGDWRRSLELVLPWLVVFWIGGVGILTLRLLLGWRQLNRLKHTHVAALSPTWPVRLKDLQQRLAVTVRQVLALGVEVRQIFGDPRVLG